MVAFARETSRQATMLLIVIFEFLQIPNVPNSLSESVSDVSFDRLYPHEIWYVFMLRYAMVNVHGVPLVSAYFPVTTTLLLCVCHAGIRIRAILLCAVHLRAVKRWNTVTVLVGAVGRLDGYSSLSERVL